ncbi:MAG: Rieske 2Fe-2S domain-containing protein [Alphaproteobacteria bacterium]|nr:Rieske 2Fe-2S domain-containing protein [Alphaproteobacteria bacterium]
MKLENFAQRRYDHEAGWRINPDAGDDAPERKFPYVDNGTDRIDPARYHDPGVARREWERLWTRVWLVAGRASDIPNRGDWFKFDIGKESVIVVRTGTEPGDIRAFYNVCHHRGNRLVMADFGHGEHFTCAFHSWQWNIDGSLNRITDRDTFRDELIRDDPPLAPVRCGQWGGFVFVNLDPAPAQGLTEFLGSLPAQLAPFRFEDMVVVKDVQTWWPANWKTALDAFLESYHVHSIHSEILPFYDDYYQQWDLLENGMSRMLMEFATVSPRVADQETVNDGLKMMLADAGMDPDGFAGTAGEVRKAIQRHKVPALKAEGRWGDGLVENQATDDWAYFIFPNVTLNIHPEGFLFQRFRPDPKDPEGFVYDVQVILHPVEKAAPPVYMGVEDGTDCSGRTRPERRHIRHGEPGLGFVLDQDSMLVPVVQQGLHSRAFRGMRFSEQEQRLRHFHKELDRYLAGEK